MSVGLMLIYTVPVASAVKLLQRVLRLEPVKLDSMLSVAGLLWVRGSFGHYRVQIQL